MYLQIAYVFEARPFQAKCWITFTQGHMTWQLFSDLFCLPSSDVLLYLTPLKNFTINHFAKCLSRVFLEHLNQNFHGGFKNWLKMQSVTFSNFKLKTHLHLISVHFMHWLTLFYFLTNDKNSTYIFPPCISRGIFFYAGKSWALYSNVYLLLLSKLRYPKVATRSMSRFFRFSDCWQRENFMLIYCKLDEKN